jgi:hypothetical protein
LTIDVNLPYSLQQELSKVSDLELPPVHLWQPERVYPIDLVINDNGDWLYEGSRINRPRLVRLFSRILRREADDYFLVTPVEACQITVNDVPFLGVGLSFSGEGRQQTISMNTNVGDEVLVSDVNPLTFKVKDEVPMPYVLVRDGLWAKLNRSSYYSLMAALIDVDGQLGIWSAGANFPIPEELLVDGFGSLP